MEQSRDDEEQKRIAELRKQGIPEDKLIDWINLEDERDLWVKEVERLLGIIDHLMYERNDVFNDELKSVIQYNEDLLELVQTAHDG